MTSLMPSSLAEASDAASAGAASASGAAAAEAHARALPRIATLKSPKWAARRTYFVVIDAQFNN
jgi:hypothetical protein